MAFKRDSKKSTAITPVARGALTKNNGGTAGQFQINRDSLVAQVVPPGGMQMMNEISQGLGGIDILNPQGWTKEQVIQANKMAQDLDEKMMMMPELMPAVMKFLQFQVAQAEFQAEVMTEAFKAKYKIDKAQAKAFVAYFAYMRKASQLEKRIAATQKHIDAAYAHFETVQDARSNAILAGLNQQARLGVAAVESDAELADKRREAKAENAQRRRQLRSELRTGHLTAN